MSRESVVVIHLTEAGDEAVSQMQRSIDRELASGRDVVVVSECARLKREARLMLARPAIARARSAVQGGCGRLAIVNGGNVRSENLPTEISRCVQFFANMDAAMSWLSPIAPGPLSQTFRYFTLPATQAG